MSLFGTIARGLGARVMLSVGSMALAALAVAGALLGPSFADAVTRSYVVTRLNEAPPVLSGTSWRFTPDSGSDTEPGQAEQDAVRAVAAAITAPYATTQTSLETTRIAALNGNAMLLSIAQECDHLEVTGACPQRPGEALLAAIDGEPTGLEIGDVADLGEPYGQFTIVGTYNAPEAGTEDFWFEPLRLGSVPRRVDTRTGVVTPFAPAPLIVDASSFESLSPEFWTVRVDRRLAIPADFDRPVLERALSSQPKEGALVDTRTGSLEVDSAGDLTAVAAEIRLQERTARTSIAPAVLSLILVALALLFRLLSAAAQLRAPELALASLRGVTTRQLWGLGLAEPLLVLAFATPFGVAAGIGLVLGLSRWWLTDGLPLVLPWSSWAAAFSVLAAGVLVAAFSVGSVVRVPLSTQLGGAHRPGARPRWVLLVELTLGALALAVVVGTLVGSSDQGPDLTHLVLPILLGVVAGLAATRAVAAVATWWARRGAKARSITGFITTRALSRRREGTLVILPITAAVAIGVFSFGVHDAAAGWRASVAATRAPASVVWDSPLSFSATYDLTHDLDPEARWMMSASTLDAVGGRVTVVDAARMGRVLNWRPEWTPGLEAADLGSRLAPDITSPEVSGRTIGLTVQRDLESNREVWAELRMHPTGGAALGEPRTQVYVGPFPPGLSTQTVRLDGCDEGCRLDGLTFGGQAALPAVMRGTLELRGILVDDREVTGGVDAFGWLESPDLLPASNVAEVSSAGGVVTIDADTQGRPGQARLTTGAIPRARPVVVGVGFADNLFEDSLQLTAERLVVDPVATSASIPLVGPDAMLIDFTMVTADRLLYDDMFVNAVLMRGDAPPEMRQALADRGFGVRTTLDAEQGTLNRGAYALALRLYLVVAALVLAMALAGLLVSTAVQLPERRRDAAALRVVGVRRMVVLRALAWEFVFALGAATFAGLAAGTLAQDIVLRSITLGYVDTAATPALVTSIDSGRLAVWAVGCAATLGVLALVTAWLTVRNARGASLREEAK